MTLHLRPSDPLPSGLPGLERPLSLGFLSKHNPYDRTAFSGTAHYAARALMAHPGIALEVLGGHRPRHLADRILRRRAAPVTEPDTATLGRLDAIVGLVATPLLDSLAARHDIPFLHVTDATPRFLRDSYGWDVPEAAFAAETRVAGRAARVVYSSRSMAMRAADDLGLPGLSPAVQPFGINLDLDPPGSRCKPSLSPLRLLFVGADWERKGGDRALATLDALRRRGVDAELTVVGRIPAHVRAHRGVRVAGFLNKNRRRDRRRLLALYTRAHLLLLPSLGDCTPMVVAEAMAHGTPVLASDTGGIAELIGGPGAGRLMPQDAPPEAWAKAVREMTRRPDVYALLSDGARDRAAAEVSWRAWAEGIHTLAATALRARPANAA